MDNVFSDFYVRWAPEIAMKRAMIRLIIDMLELQDVVLDLELPELISKEQLEKERAERAAIKDAIKKGLPIPATEEQKKALKELFKASGKKARIDYDSLTRDEAEAMISKLQKKENGNAKS
jgi:hypothetical protein